MFKIKICLICSLIFSFLSCGTLTDLYLENNDNNNALRRAEDEVHYSQYKGVYIDCNSGDFPNKNEYAGNYNNAIHTYEQLFDKVRPKTAEDFQWTSELEDPRFLDREEIQKIKFPSLPVGQSLQYYYDHHDFKERFERNILKTNFELFEDPATTASNVAPYEKFNPFEWIPASVTHYGKSEFTDRMAEQMYYYAVCVGGAENMDKLLARCPDCIDFYTPLSENDNYTVMEMRFVVGSYHLPLADGKQVHISKPFKVIAIDAAADGDMQDYATRDEEYRMASYGPGFTKWVGARRRGEISGLLAKTLGTYGGPTGAWIRSADKDLQPVVDGTENVDNQDVAVNEENPALPETPDNNGQTAEPINPADTDYDDTTPVIPPEGSDCKVHGFYNRAFKNGECDYYACSHFLKCVNGKYKVIPITTEDPNTSCINDPDNWFDKNLCGEILY